MTLQEILEEAKRKLSAPGVQNTGHTGAAGLTDLGWTEYVANKIAPKAYASSGGSNLLPGENSTGAILNTVAPVPYQAAKTATKIYDNLPQTGGGGGQQQPQNTGGGGSELDELREIERAGNLNPAQRTRLAELTKDTGGGGGVDFNAILQQQRALARQVYDEGMRRASAAFDRTRGIVDEGRQLLGKRKEEFKGLFDEGGAKILDTYEGERGNLQSSAEGAATRSANSLRAMGLGGSAVIKSEGKQRQNNVKALGSLQTQRDTNDSANKREYDERLNWANVQDSALTRQLADAEEARRSAEAQAGLIEAGDVQGINERLGGYLQSILSNQMAAEQASKATGEYVANPYAVDINSFKGALQSVVPTIGGAGAGGIDNMGVNIQEQDPRLALLRKRAGGALYA